MEFWEDLSKKLSDAADYTVKETNKLTEIAKLKYRLSSLRGKENDLYTALGKLRYAEYLGETPEDSAYEGLFARIADAKAEIAVTETRLGTLRNYKFCVACNEKIAINMTFCPYCGTKQIPLDREPGTKKPADDEAPSGTDDDNSGDAEQ